ncbi:MAG: type II secretion system major pseudopilin GspG [Planctomycetes bacterium]|nr:type II secretion system major pseudopilin GspG [Planctomycetota bacterium]
MNHQPATSPTRPAEAGFTLVEIMVVIVILGLLATLVAKNVIGASDEARLTKAQTDVRQIADGVRSYRAKNGKLPDSLEVLATKDDRGRSELEELPKDPWGNDYYLREGDRPMDWEVISWGPDGSEGTDDDVSSKAKKDQ